MYLIYIDEAGTPEPFKKDPKHFSLTACIINEKDWDLIDNQIVSLKRRYFLNHDPDKVELHAKFIYHKSGFFMRALRGNQNFNLLGEFYRNISELPIILISIVIDKKRLEKQQSENTYIVNYTPDQLSWHYLIERLCKFLNKENALYLQQGKGNQFGLLLIDNQSNKKLNRKVRNIILNYLRGKKFIKIGKKVISTKYLLKEIHFLESEFFNLSQTTDLIAYVINRRHSSQNKTSKIDSHVEKYYTLLEKLFDTDEFGVKKGCGIKIYPEN